MRGRSDYCSRLLFFVDKRVVMAWQFGSGKAVTATRIQKMGCTRADKSDVLKANN
jgi:hypothetical protein